VEAGRGMIMIRIEAGTGTGTETGEDAPNNISHALTPAICNLIVCRLVCKSLDSYLFVIIGGILVL
jgi:hypothetical protein